jgi:hypothetical protein
VPKPLQISTRNLGWKAGDLADYVVAKSSAPLAA